MLFVSNTRNAVHNIFPGRNGWGYWILKIIISNANLLEGEVGVSTARQSVWRFGRCVLVLFTLGARNAVRDYFSRAKTIGSTTLVFGSLTLLACNPLQKQSSLSLSVFEIFGREARR